MFHVLKTPVCQFDHYRNSRPCGPMRIIFGIVIWSWYTSLNIKFGVNRTFHVLKTPVYRFGLYGRYQILWTDHFQYRPMANRSLFAKFEVRSFLRSDAIVIYTGGRTDGHRHSSNVLEFRADQMSLRNLGSQINISMRPTRIDKTNIPSMRRV